MALIQITDLTFTYPGSFDPVFEHVSFQLDTDWRLGLTGRNGRGKTTLLRLLQGQYPHQGTITAPAGFRVFPVSHPRRGAHAARGCWSAASRTCRSGACGSSWRRYS
ncbi:MAG: ATP-binding cassette domain-containing protein [Acutalibacteraceae bacterium]